jgi:HAD superfamily hydrolase (TIGR01549 family)
VSGAVPRALLFDLDGTLYRQPPLRLRMAAELLVSPLRGPLGALRAARGVAVFRRTREELRGEEGDLERLQYARAAERVGVDAAQLEAWVREWIHERPLRYLRRLRAPGLVELLDALAERGVRAGVFSDYPAHAKLEALGVDGRFDPVLCATDREIGAFKPNPRGFLRACELWGLAPADVLYVGDRADVDAEGARRAGMPCVLVGGSPTLPAVGADSTHVFAVRSLGEIVDAIDRGRG